MYQWVLITKRCVLFYDTLYSLLNLLYILFDVIIKILSLDRIENKFLYTQYVSYKEFLQSKYTKTSQIEHNLFHGTSGDCVENISKFGFNRSFAGKNANDFADDDVHFAVHFARFASYGHIYTDIKRTGKPVGHMFLCRVLVGSWALGNSFLYGFYLFLCICFRNFSNFFCLFDILKSISTSY